MLWNILTSVATLISMVAFILTALYARKELKALEKDRYLAVTNDLFVIWQSEEFMTAQLWVLHRLEEATWQDFVKNHRGDTGERAFHRVGSFYDRVGTLVRLGLVDDREILSTVGGYAIAVWQKMAPLVEEARRIENSALFDDFERLLPSCYECYVPALGKNAQVHPFSLSQPVERIAPAALKARIDTGEPLTVLDARQPDQFARDRRTLPNAVVIPPDQIAQRYAELPPEREVVVYCA